MDEKLKEQKKRTTIYKIRNKKITLYNMKDYYRRHKKEEMLKIDNPHLKSVLLQYSLTHLISRKFYIEGYELPFPFIHKISEVKEHVTKVIHPMSELKDLAEKFDETWYVDFFENQTGGYKDFDISIMLESDLNKWIQKPFETIDKSIVKELLEHNPKTISTNIENGLEIEAICTLISTGGGESQVDKHWYDRFNTILIPFIITSYARSFNDKHLVSGIYNIKGRYVTGNPKKILGVDYYSVEITEAKLLRKLDPIKYNLLEFIEKFQIRDFTEDSLINKFFDMKEHLIRSMIKLEIHVTDFIKALIIFAVITILIYSFFKPIGEILIFSYNFLKTNFIKLILSKIQIR